MGSSTWENHFHVLLLFLYQIGLVRTKSEIEVPYLTRNDVIGNRCILQFPFFLYMIWSRINTCDYANFIKKEACT